MPTRTQVLIPIVVAAVIIGVAGMLTLPTDVKLESVEFPRGTIKLDDKTLGGTNCRYKRIKRQEGYHGILKMSFRMMRECYLSLMGSGYTFYVDVKHAI